MTREQPRDDSGDPSGRGPLDDDVAWAEIVRQYGDRADLPPEEPPAPSVFDRPSYDLRRGAPADPLNSEPTDWEDEGHFVPPEPPPLPRPPLPRALAWAGVVAVPVVLVVLAVFRVALPPGLAALAIVWFLSGFAYLFATMRRGGDGFDDGARL